MNQQLKTEIFDQQVIEAYFDYLESMNADNVTQLAEHCSVDVHFRDPFNNVRGVDAYLKIMEEAFHDLKNVSFEIIEKAWSSQGAIIKWHFHFSLGKGGMEKITGVSEVKSANGKIIAHLDYWDSGERIYAKIPVVGALIRFMRKKLSVGMDNTEPF